MSPLGACVGLQTAPTAGTPKVPSQWLKRAKMSTGPTRAHTRPSWVHWNLYTGSKGQSCGPCVGTSTQGQRGKSVSPAHLVHPQLPTVGPCGHVFWVAPQIKCASLNFQVTEALTGLSLAAVSPLGFDLSEKFQRDPAAWFSFYILNSAGFNSC